MPLLVWFNRPLTPVEKKLPLPSSQAKSIAKLAQLRARDFHHFHLEQNLLHAADVDVVDHLRGVVLGQPHDRADVVGPIDEARQHQAFAVAIDSDRGMRELRLQRDWTARGRRRRS